MMRKKNVYLIYLCIDNFARPCKILTLFVCVCMFVLLYYHHTTGIKNEKREIDTLTPRACACSNRSLKFHDINGEKKKHGRNAASRDAMCIYYRFYSPPANAAAQKHDRARRVNIPTGARLSSPPQTPRNAQDYRNRVCARPSPARSHLRFI